MAENRIYVALGEESSRGAKESTTVGFIPCLSPTIPKMEFDEKRRAEFRGEATLTGDSAITRFSRKWSGTIEMPLYTEAGTTPGMVGTLLRHFFGTVSTVETPVGQYNHMMYPVSDPFSTANLGNKALTLNLNINEGSVMKNWPFVGARVKSLSFEQEAGNHLKVSAETFGQCRDTITAEIGTPVFAAENLRCDYNNMTLYTGAITRTGTAPDYTDFTFTGATQIKPDKLSVKIENGMEDILRLTGGNVDYPDKTRMGKFKVSIEFTIDWEDPSSGFSSVNEFTAWITSSYETNFCLHWDTGTVAGTGGNHGLYIDIPRAQLTGGEPSYSLDKDPMVTFKYEGLLDAATGYMVGLLLKNSATAV